MLEDVPSPIDLRLMSDAREWEATATAMRPWRAELWTDEPTEGKEQRASLKSMFPRDPGRLATSR